MFEDAADIVLGSLGKAGSGALTLSGGNTYSGGTTISGGTMCLAGSLGTGDVVNDATLMGYTTSVARLVEFYYRATRGKDSARLVYPAAYVEWIERLPGANRYVDAVLIGPNHEIAGLALARPPRRAGRAAASATAASASRIATMSSCPGSQSRMIVGRRSARESIVRGGRQVEGSSERQSNTLCDGVTSASLGISAPGVHQQHRHIRRRDAGDPRGQPLNSLWRAVPHVWSEKIISPEGPPSADPDPGKSCRP